MNQELKEIPEPRAVKFDAYTDEGVGECGREDGYGKF
jgi:hypothetical protein